MPQNPVLWSYATERTCHYLYEYINETKFKFVENKKLEERTDTLEFKSHDSFTL